MIQSITTSDTDHHIEEIERESVEDGEHMELVVGNLSLFVTTSGETTSVVLVDGQKGRQSSIIVEEETWVTR